MVRFEVLEPRDLKEALVMLANHKQEAKIIAGGQSLLPLLKHRQIIPRYLINIKGLPGLEYINKSNDGLKIGALATHRAIEFSPLVKERYPVLAEMELRLGCVQTRNWGTLVGSICHASPTGDPAPNLIALGAKLKVVGGRGERVVAVEDFFCDYCKSAIEPDEIVLEIEIPGVSSHTGCAYHKESVRMTDSPIASVAAVVTLDKNTVHSVKIVLQAVGPIPIRAVKAEKLLVGEKVQDSLLGEVAAIASKEARPISDIYGTAEYKREMVKVITKQVISQAIKRAAA